MLWMIAMSSLDTKAVLVQAASSLLGIKHRAEVLQSVAKDFTLLGTLFLVVGGLFLAILSLCSCACIFYDLGGFAMCLGGLVAFAGYGLFAAVPQI
jgi:hypothetical protein